MKLYWPGWLIFRIVGLRYRVAVEGRENLPPKGTPMIIVSNHNSRRDPVEINIMINRPVHFMAKKESFDWRNGIFEYLMVSLFEAFPVDRNHPGPEVIRTTEKLLSEGKIVGIFPEGTRFPDKSLHPFEGGAAYIAWRTGATLLPIAVYGDVVHIGKPFKLTPMEGRPRTILPKVTMEIRERIIELLPEGWEILPQD